MEHYYAADSPSIDHPNNSSSSVKSAFDRCNSSTSSSSSTIASTTNECSTVTKRQTGMREQQTVVGKRFFVSRVHQQQLLANQPNRRHQEQKTVPEGGRRKEAKQDGGGVEEEERGTKSEEEEELVSFRYTWPVRISERLIGADESAILNVSPPFCTAYNGVQFTWLVRICEENILDFGGGCSNDNTISSRSQMPLNLPNGGYDEDEDGGFDGAELFGRKKVNITLYYKEGPARDVRLHGGNIAIRNSKGVLFEEMPLRELEYTKGGGWSPICAGLRPCSNIPPGQRKFSEFIHANVGKQITVRVKLEMPASLFQPMQYLPSIDSPISGKLETLGEIVLEEIRSNELHVPDLEFFDPKKDKYALYRHVYQFGCQEILRRFTENSPNIAQKDPDLMEKIRNIFAYCYFNKVIVREAECFEDFLEALDASRNVQFPALRRECERYICAEVMAESADLTLAKKMLLLAERFELPILKMVSFGVIVDRLLMQPETGNNNTNAIAAKAANNAIGMNSPASDGKNTNISTGQHQHWSRRSTDSGMTIESSMEEIREELLEIAEQIISSEQSHHHNPAQHGANSSSSILPSTRISVNRVHSKSLCGNSTSDDELADGEENDSDDEDDEVEAGGDTLVGSVIAQLEELARHIRKVSMPPGVRPAPSQNGRVSPEFVAPLASEKSDGQKSMQQQFSGTDSGNGSSMDSRRSSLRTGRDILQQQRMMEEEKCGNELGEVYQFHTDNSDESIMLARRKHAVAKLCTPERDQLLLMDGTNTTTTPNCHLQTGASGGKDGGMMAAEEDEGVEIGQEEN